MPIISTYSFDYKQRTTPLLYAIVTIGGKHYEALVDCGAQKSAMNSKLYCHMSSRSLLQPTCKVKGADGHLMISFGEHRTHFNIGGEGYSMTFVVIESLEHPLILGLDFLFKENGVLYLNPTAPELVLHGINGAHHVALTMKHPFQISTDLLSAISRLEHEQNDKATLCEEREGKELCLEGDSIPDLTKPNSLSDGDIIRSLFGAELNKQQKEQVVKLLREFEDVLGAKAPPVAKDRAGQPLEFEVTLKEGAKAPWIPTRVGSPEKHKLLQELVDELFGDDIIEFSDADASSPVFLVPKTGKTGQGATSDQWRLVVDFRALNKVVERTNFPIPRIQDIFAFLGGSYYFSKLDILMGFYHILVNEQSRGLLSFNVPPSHYQFKRMPMGINNAPNFFQSAMVKLFADFIYKFLCVYIDDLLIFSKSFEEHIMHVRMVLERLRQHCLCAKISKCQFFQKELVFLGHTVARDGVRANKKKVKALLDMPLPTTQSELLSFLCLANYFHAFIPHFSNIASPLYAMVEGKSQKSKALLHLTEEHKRRIEQLKQELIKEHVVHYPDPNFEYFLSTDSSNYACGAVLTMRDPTTRHEYVGGYFSRKYTRIEQTLATVDQECLAIVYAIEHFKELLFNKPFVVITDAAAIERLKIGDFTERMKQRWLLRIHPWADRMTFVHRAGKDNIADCLSRLVEHDREQERIVLSSIVAGITKEELLEAQKADSKLQLLRLELEKKPFKSTIDWLGEKVYLHESSGLLMCKAHCIIIPSSNNNLKAKTMQLEHDFAGHLGSAKTRKRVGRFFFWSNMNDDIKQYVHSCETCGRVKAKRVFTGGLGSIAPVEQFNDRVSLDLQVFSQSQTSNGANYILVMLDHCTRWVELAALRNKEANTVANAFIRGWIARHGAPRVLLTDQGTEFSASVVANICEQWGIQHRFTSSYNPSCNGIVERANATLKDMIRAAAGTQEWDTLLPMVQLHYNSAYHESTGVSPARAVYGRDIYLPNEIGLLHDVAKPTTVESQMAWQHMLAKKGEAAREAAAKATAESQRKAQERFAELHPNQHVFKIGDKVMRLRDALTRDMATGVQNKFTGPHTITGLSGLVARLDNRNEAINVRKLKPFSERPAHLIPTHSQPQQQQQQQKLRRSTRIRHRQQNRIL